jgi:hypothetical protein
MRRTHILFLFESLGKLTSAIIKDFTTSKMQETEDPGICKVKEWRV